MAGTVHPTWPAGNTAMARRIRDFDWAATPLGPLDRWPPALKTIVGLMLESPGMMSLVWGPEAIHLFNDGFTELLREHHADALGRSALITFARSREVFEADLAAGMAGGSARLAAQRYPVLRHGRLEDAWFDVDYAPVRDERGVVAGVLWTLKETTAQVRAERALRESEARHRLLVGSWARAVWETDARGVVVADSPSWRACTGQSLEEWLGYGWVNAIHPDDRVYAERQWREAVARGGLVDAEFRLQTPAGGARWTNVRAAPLLDADGQIEKWVGMNIDIDDRRRADDARRESEERFQQFATASAAGLWVRHAASLETEFISPAMSVIYGVAPDDLAGSVARWAAMIVPDDRDEALAHMERAGRGDTASSVFRVQRAADGAFRWMRDTSFPLRNTGAIGRIGGITEDITEAKLAVEHQQVLLAELQHRVRNIMAMLRSIVMRTADSAASVADYTALLGGRLDTFARVQGLLTRAAGRGVDLDAIVRDELMAMAADGGQIDVDGPAVELAPKAAEAMTLAVHELATNALKHGALSTPEGRVTVRWTVAAGGGESRLCFDWTETGAPPRRVDAGPPRVGFGSELIQERIPYELDGTGSLLISPGGARCRLAFPLQEGTSILQTDAPRRATVFGGAIDMTGQASMMGQRVLVLEDDYYLASDLARALRGAGAEVIGPFATEEAGRGAIAQAVPTCAVLDINLRNGRSLSLAGEFAREGVPFIFVTGYDQDVIPPAFAHIARLQKPVAFREVIGTLAATLGT